MTKRILYILIFLIVLLPTIALAATVKTGQDVFVNTIEKNLYLFGQIINVNANVLGDLTAFGASVIIDKNVEDSLFVAGGTVDLKGIIGRHLRAVGGNVTIDNQIGGDALISGGSITTSPETNIAGDFIFSGGSLTYNGLTGGYTKINAGTVNINGTLNGNVDIKAQEIVIGERAVILGKLTYWSENEAKIASGAQLKGGKQFNKTQAKPVGIATLGTKSGLLNFFISLLSLIVIAILLLYLLPQLTQRTTKIGIDSPLAAFWTGLASVILIPLIILLLLISSIGTLSGLSLTFLYIGVLIIAYAIAAIWIGTLIFKFARREKEAEVGIWQAVVGAVVLAILGWIPILGPLVKMIVFIIALGTIVLLIRELYQKNKLAQK